MNYELSMEIGKGLSSIKLFRNQDLFVKMEYTILPGKVRDEKSPNKGHR